mgnify:FL=1
MYFQVDFIDSLTAIDKEVLRSIYLLRCLDENLMYEMFYSLEGKSRDYVMRRVRKFMKYKIIEKVGYGEEYPAIFLTTNGIGLLRNYLNLPVEAYLRADKKTALGIYNYKDLRLDAKLIKHQIYLNTFVLEFRKRALEKDLQWTYYDEKYLSKYTMIRPDGMIRIGSYDLFLEMDMGTETTRQLNRKWTNYRRFYNSDEYFQREQDIKILFIIGNVKNPEIKADRIKTIIYNELGDIIDKDFDFYAAGQDELLDIIFKKLIPDSPYNKEIIPDFKSMMMRSCGFILSSGDRLASELGRVAFDLYARKLNNLKKILVVDKTPQEFVIDINVGSPLSLFKKISYIKQTSVFFENKFKRPLKYIIILEENKETEFYKASKAFGIVPSDNIYFSTRKRIMNMQFYEALYQYDSLGSIFHFTDYSLTSRVFERSI